MTKNNNNINNGVGGFGSIGNLNINLVIINGFMKIDVDYEQFIVDLVNNNTLIKYKTIIITTNNVQRFHYYYLAIAIVYLN